MLRRRSRGISADWATDIQFWLETYLDYLEWQPDETKTYDHLEELNDNYSQSSYRKPAYQIRLFLEHLDISWTDNIKPPPEPRKLPKRVTTNDINSALNHFKGHPYDSQMKAIILLGSSNGMRPEEMYQLDQDDIDLDQCLIRINHDPNNGYSVKTGR